jgi:hypothetical protein
MARPTCAASVSMGRYGHRICGDPATVRVNGRPFCPKCQARRAFPAATDVVECINAPRVTLAQINTALAAAGHAERLARATGTRPIDRRGFVVEGGAVVEMGEGTFLSSCVGPDRLDGLTVEEWVAAVVAKADDYRRALRLRVIEESLRV